MRRWREANRAKAAERSEQWRQRNPEKVRAAARAHYARNPAKARDKQLRRKFGITLAEYETLRAAQSDRCAICNTDEPKGKGDWHVDHDHATGAVRGLLCYNCNVGLGHFQDDPLRLELAAAYLRSHQR